MKSPQEKLKEIGDHKVKDFLNGTWVSMPGDVAWLIARIHQLEKALEWNRDGMPWSDKIGNLSNGALDALTTDPLEK